MAYASGGLIEASDYNGFVSSVNNIWNVGSGDSGYGQSNALVNVTPISSVVTAAQWNALLGQLTQISRHQTGGTIALANVTNSQVITYMSTLSSTIATLNTNRLNFVAQGTSTNTQVSNATTWFTTCTKEVAMTFANANAMRYFFNCGGEIVFTAKNSTLTTYAKSLDWDALLNACGDVRIRAQTSGKVAGSGGANPGTPTVENTNLGFYDMTTTYQKILQQYSPTLTGGYNLNNASFEARLNAAPGSSTILYLKVTLTDSSSDLVNDFAYGTTAADFKVTYPELTYLSNTWGAITTSTLTNTQA